MVRASRFRVTLALLGMLTFAASCSKPVAPAADLSPDAPAFAASSADTVTLLRLVFDTHLANAVAGWPQGRHRNPFLFTIPAAPTAFPSRDTIPAHSSLMRVEWWRRDTTGWSVVRAPVSSVRLDQGTTASSTADMPAGVQRLFVQRPPELGGGHVRFLVFVGLVPTEWWAGPDPSRWPVSPDGAGRAVDIRDWSRFTTSSVAWPPDGRGWFGPDSFAYRLSDRRPLTRGGERRTFWEISGNRIYARSDGDTVHAFSILVFSHGGRDLDSPYVPHVAAGDPALPAGWDSGDRGFAALQAAGVIGSPVGMRTLVAFRTPDGMPWRQAETTTYPWFDPASVYRWPAMHYYYAPQRAGKYYVLARAEDGDRQLGRPEGVYTNSIQDAVDRVDAGGGSQLERDLRRRVLTFYVPIPAR